ncbi:MAG: DUF2225 domain-containing protein [Clostridium sp.]|jgi:uncharacterized protein (DUF2225 family)|nr:DUF2225 domain-containing protein [Clostridium sp.]
MAGLLSGLASLGLEHLEGVDIFGPSEEERKAADAMAAAGLEASFLYDRTFECPVCGNKFTSKTVKTGKAKLLGTDMDLRPVYEGIDMRKYDVPLCGLCAYAALNQYFGGVSAAQAKRVKDHISQNVTLKKYGGETYTYEEALERYKLALACAVVKGTRASEKAYICLKSAWLVRGSYESLDETAPDSPQKLAALKEQEDEYLKSAYEGFVEARKKEPFPMCGMDTDTVDYLIAVLAARFKKFDVAGRLLGAIITAPEANKRIKDRARDLKNAILEELKKEKR